MPGCATTRVAGTSRTAGSAPERLALGGGVRRCDDVTTGAALVMGATEPAGDASGFPQSMQKRESAAFGRPQKAQEFKAEPPGCTPV